MSGRLDSGSRPAAVVFDCDGVLIESVEIKTRAFVELFADHPEHHAAIVEHHETHLGISRYEKIRWILEVLLGRQPTAGELVALGRRFSELVLDAARSCPEVRGATATLIELFRDDIPLFVASGTPQEELDEVIDARGWGHLFQGVYGSPTTKPEILSGITASLDTHPTRILFVGDGRSDYEAARRTGVTFVLRGTSAQRERFRGYAGPRITDLEGFVERLDELSRPVV